MAMYQSQHVSRIEPHHDFMFNLYLFERQLHWIVEMQNFYAYFFCFALLFAVLFFPKRDVDFAVRSLPNLFIRNKELLLLTITYLFHNQ